MKKTGAALGFARGLILAGMLAVLLAVWLPNKFHQPEPLPTPPAMQWEPITLGMAMMLADYSNREDWTGCETKGVSPLFIRCPDGYALEIR